MPKGRRQPMAVRSGALLAAVVPQVNAVAAEKCTAPEVKDRSRRGFPVRAYMTLTASPDRQPRPPPRSIRDGINPRQNPGKITRIVLPVREEHPPPFSTLSQHAVLMTR
jgi:hypothetical protein